jgi:uncharacterized membrane protein YbhN (UPF0104 family)
LVVRLLVLGALAYVAVQVVLANSSELSGAARYLERANWGWVAIAAAAEAASFLNFTLLQQRLLQAGGVTLGLLPLGAMSLAGTAITNSLPGGGAFATVFAYRQFRRRGADEAITTWTIVAFTALTAITLAVLAVIGLLIAGSDSGVAGLWALVPLLVATPLLAVAALLRPTILRPLLLGPTRLAKRVSGHPAGPPADAVQHLIDRLGAVTPGVGDWAWGLVFAAGNWIGDCLCLVVAFAAVGAGVPWRGLLVAYGAAQVAANLPITPGGLGVVEGSLTVALVAFGGSTAQTVAAVLLYRILNFWVVLPLGWGAWVGLELDVRKRRLEEAAT